MRRLTTGIALALLSVSLLGCGGASHLAGGTTGGNTNKSSDPKALHVLAPDHYSGQRDASVVPGEVNLQGGATQSQLTGILTAHGYTPQAGYSVVSFSHGSAMLTVPAGKEQAVAAALDKEFLLNAQPVLNHVLPNASYDAPTVRKTSFTPSIPFYAEGVGGFNYDGTTTSIAPSGSFTGQSVPMNIQGFPTAWDVCMNASVAAEPVKIAIIDAGWWDFTTVNQPGFDETSLDAANSGHVDGTGTFTAGFTAATWDTYTDGGGNLTPVRETGAQLLGLIGADPFEYAPNAFDLNGDTVITPDEVWNIGMAGVDSGFDSSGTQQGGVKFILIKTGTINNATTPPTWQVSDNEMAHSIDHAVAAGANIIVTGFATAGAVAPVVSTAITNARTAQALFICPAGDVVQSFTAGPPPGFANTPVDITVTPFTPASAPNAVSVAGTGYNGIKAGDLPQVDFGAGPINNNGAGWSMHWNAPFDADWNKVADWSNTGATIAGEGWGMGFGSEPFLVGGTPSATLPGIPYTNTINRFGTQIAAGYVAGSAAQVFQALSFANGSPPTDVQVLAGLTSTAQVTGMTGVTNGLLNAGLAAVNAINGGSLITQLPAVQLTTFTASQPFAAVTRGTDFSVTPTVINDSGALVATVDWGDGSAPQVVNPWVNGTAITFTGGWANLGRYAVNVSIKDTNNLTVMGVFGVHVIDPLAVSITISDASGAPVAASALKVGTTYRFNANPANVYTGDGNVVTYNWDFNGDATNDATGPSPTFTFAAAGSFTTTLNVTETIRPNTTRTLAVVVAP